MTHTGLHQAQPVTKMSSGDFAHDTLWCHEAAYEKEGRVERHFAAAHGILLAEITLKLHMHKIRELNKMRKWV